jgi:RES domain-containing protein
MHVYRLTKKKHASLSGKGAERFGGRWNSKGIPMIYSSDSRSLSMLEKYIHLPSGILPKDFVMMTIDIPDTIAVDNVDEKTLGKNWKYESDLLDTKKIGDDFILSDHACVLCVPSAIVPGDHNFLLNPNHRDFEKIKTIEIIDFPFDKRLFGK